MNRCVQKSRMLVSLTVTTLLLAGCKKDRGEDVPEHVQQQRKLEARLKARLEAEEQKGRAERAKADPDPYGKWSAPVRQAYYALYQAKSTENMLQAAQQLAQLGPTGVQALRRVAQDPARESKKRALASFLLVDRNMFRVDELGRLAVSFELPFAQRSAIEALVRIGNADADAKLAALPAAVRAQAQALTRARAGDSGVRSEAAAATPAAQGSEPVVTSESEGEPPLLGFATELRSKVTPWRYTPAQLQLLDGIHQAENLSVLKAALAAVTDRTVEQGLLALLKSPASRDLVRTGVAFKLTDLARETPAVLAGYVAVSQPRDLRAMAARALVESGRSADAALVQWLAKDKRDPLAPLFARMLESRQKAAPKQRASQKP